MSMIKPRATIERAIGTYSDRVSAAHASRSLCRAAFAAEKFGIDATVAECGAPKATTEAPDNAWHSRGRSRAFWTGALWGSLVTPSLLMMLLLDLVDGVSTAVVARLAALELVIVVTGLAISAAAWLLDCPRVTQQEGASGREHVNEAVVVTMCGPVGEINRASAMLEADVAFIGKMRLLRRLTRRYRHEHA